MRFVIETVFWLFVTGLIVIWLWGFTPWAVAVALILSLLLSLIGGNILFNRENWS